MFSCFKLNISERYYDYFIDRYYDIGTQFLNSKKTQVFNELERYINQHDQFGAIDGSKLQDDWFKELSLDVFISHSHADEELAISIAGWLHQEFNLSAFVDSQLWGYANDLLDKINSKYNIIHQTSTNTTYSYAGCNNAASHVHMMLCTSLNKMIDRCETMFFLNTNNSLITYSGTDKTISPWIYSEICLANTIRRRKPKRYGNYLLHENTRTNYVYACEMVIEYNVDFTGFIDLDFSDLLHWHKQRTEFTNSLDSLYKITNLLKTK